MKTRVVAVLACLSPATALVSLACGEGSPTSGVGEQRAALVASVGMRLSVQSHHRVMVAGPGDGGHTKTCCYSRRVPLSACPAWLVQHWDGSTLSPGGVFWASGQRASLTSSNRVEGPYNCEDGSTSEWEFPPWIDGVADVVSQEIASVTYFDADPNPAFPSSVYTFVWKEIDGVSADDRVEWRVEVANWVDSCNVASNHGVNGVYVVDSGFINGGNLCDSRGCDYGDYAVAYTVRCSVSGGADPGGGAGPGGTPPGGGPPTGGGCGSHNLQCYSGYNACAAECCGVCERRINCGGASAHKCFE